MCDSVHVNRDADGQCGYKAQESRAALYPQRVARALMGMSLPTPTPRPAAGPPALSDRRPRRRPPRAVEATRLGGPVGDHRYAVPDVREIRRPAVDVSDGTW